MFDRKLVFNSSVLALVAVTAACGGGEKANEPAATGDTQAAAVEAPATTAAPATGNIVEVRMVTTQGGASGEFQPAEVRVKKGDTVRFVNDGASVHNASFPPSDNPAGTPLPATGPLLTAAEATYDVVVNAEPGTYNFQCDPHAAMGMKGKLIVE